jgi:hypothetical protein
MWSFFKLQYSFALVLSHKRALVKCYHIFVLYLSLFILLFFCISQLYLYALSDEKFIRDILQIIFGYRYLKIRNNKRVFNNTLQHTIRHDKMKDVDIIL